MHAMPRYATTVGNDTADSLIHETAEAFVRAGLHFGHGTDNATDEAAWLVLWSLGLPYDCSPAQLQQPVTEAQVARIRALRAQRIDTRQPLAYLTGEAWFAGLRFRSDARALVPRSSFAELIHERFAPWVTQPPRRILDLCTGGGCIAIACAKAFPKAQVDASDLSPAALSLAADNVALHRLGRRVHLHESDLFAALPPARYDLIVSNPPYVGAREMKGLPPEYRHEPELGLETGENGLLLVRRMLAQAPDWLAPEGWLVVEVGNSDEAVMARWPDLPVTWIDFDQSEGGVFIISASELTAWRQRPRSRPSHVR